MSAIFIGCVDFSKTLLQEMLANGAIELAGVVTKRKSGMNSDFCDLTPLAREHGIPVFYYEGKDSDAEMVHWVRSKAPNVVFCFGWSHLLGAELLSTTKLGVIGYHPAALPANRGRHPIVWALALGLESTASTFFRVDQGADSGDIVSQESVAINPHDDAGSLYAKLAEIAKIQVLDICQRIKKGTLTFLPQDHEKANYWRKRTEKDGVIDWRMPTKAICDLVRALTRPYPGATLEHGGRSYVVRSALPASYSAPINAEPGKVLRVLSNGFTVKTSDGAVDIMDWDCDLRPEVGMYL